MSVLVISQNKIDVSVSIVLPKKSTRVHSSYSIQGDERAGAESVQDVREGSSQKHVDQNAKGD